MGLVCQLICPECKSKVYLASNISQVTCPNCKKGTIVNAKARLGGRSIVKSKRHVFVSKQETITSSCPKCGTQFTTPPALFRGKVFCPSCGTEVKLEGVTQI